MNDPTLAIDALITRAFKEHEEYYSEMHGPRDLYGKYMDLKSRRVPQHTGIPEFCPTSPI